MNGDMKDRGPRAGGRGDEGTGAEESLGPQPSARPDDATRWPRLYAAVLLALAAEVAIFYWFTRSFE